MAKLKLPNGTLGIILSSTNESQQEDLFFPTDPRLIAVNVNGDPECGSLVFDLNGANELDNQRGAYLQSAFRVIKRPLGRANAIAFQLDYTGKADTQGGFFCEVMQSDTMEMPPPPGESDGDPNVSAPGSLEFDSPGPFGAQFELDGGPGPTVVQGVDIPAKGGYGFGEGSHNFGGPFHVGVPGDKHYHGDDADGNPINALHLWTSANFFMNKLADGPIRFELEYKEGTERSQIVPVHIAWTGVDWAAWTSTDLYPIPIPIPLELNPLPRMVPALVSPLGLVQPVSTPGLRPGSTGTTSVDNRANPGVTAMNLVATLSAMMAPAMAFRPENYALAAAAGGLFISPPPKPKDDGKPSSQQSKADKSSPVTAVASAFGAQGGTVDNGGSGGGEKIGGEGDPWSYTQTPNGQITPGKKMSPWQGGTSSGGIVFHPPETDLRSLEDHGMVPPNTTLSDTYIMVGPNALFGAGIPDLANGQVKTGYTWGYDSSTGDLVFYSNTFTVKSEALRLTNPAQTIRWMSGQSFYGEFSHTNTADRAWTFPDVTSTISSMLFDTVAPTATAPEGTFAWDTAANNLYVNNDGATGWTLVGGAGSITGSGANTYVTYWTGAATISGEAGFTYNAGTNLLSVPNLTVSTALTNSALTAGRVIFASTAGLLADDAGFTFDGVTLTLSDSNATTTPLQIWNQASTGDSAVRWSLATTVSYAAGIDNTDDKWKLSYAASGTAVLGTNDYLTIDTSGQLTVGSFVSGTITATSALTISGITHDRLVYNDGTGTILAVANLQSWIAGTANQVITADDGDGSITLSLPQDIHTSARPQFLGLGIGAAATLTMAVRIASTVAPAGAVSAFGIYCAPSLSPGGGYGTGITSEPSVTAPAGGLDAAASFYAGTVTVGGGTTAIAANLFVATTPTGATANYAAYFELYDTSTTPAIHIQQWEVGDSCIRQAVDGPSYVFGIDNDDDDKWKLSYSASTDAELGTDDYLTVSVDGDITLGPSERWTVAAAGGLTASGNYRFSHGTTALATTATDGFLFIQSCAGTPTGVPDTIPTGQKAIVWDSTNDILYAYDGAWTAVGGGGGGGTLDDAYDFGGAGAGRTITVDTGAVTLTGGGTTVGGFTVDGSRTIASAASAVWNEVLIDADVSLSGSTNITTATGFNMVRLNAPTITDTGTVGSVTNAATLYIGGAPSGSAVSITNPYALWVDAGNIRSDGIIFAQQLVGTPTYSFLSDSDTGICSQSADGLQLRAGGDPYITIADSASSSTIEITTATASSGSASRMTLLGRGHSNQTASTEVLDVDFDLDATLQHATGAITLQRSFVVRPRTYSFVGASTITNAFTMEITGSPIAGTNATLTSSAALRVIGGCVIGSAALATNATSGFLYIPSCAGTPTGTPEAQTGTVAMVYDSTNDKLYIYDGGWLRAQVAGVDAVWA